MLPAGEEAGAAAGRPLGWWGGRWLWMGASPSALPGEGEEGSWGMCSGQERRRGSLELLGAEGPSLLLSGLLAEICLCEQTRWSEGW